MPSPSYEPLSLDLSTARAKVAIVPPGSLVYQVSVIDIPFDGGVLLHFGDHPGIPVFKGDVWDTLTADLSGCAIPMDEGLFVTNPAFPGTLRLVISYGQISLAKRVAAPILRPEDLYPFGERAWQAQIITSGGGANFHYGGIKVPTGAKVLAVVERIWESNLVATKTGVRAPGGGQQFQTAVTAMARDARTFATGESPKALCTGGWNAAQVFVAPALGQESQARAAANDFSQHGAVFGGPWTLTPGGMELIQEAEATATAVRVNIVWRERPYNP